MLNMEGNKGDWVGKNIRWDGDCGEYRGYTLFRSPNVKHGYWGHIKLFMGERFETPTQAKAYIDKRLKEGGTDD